MIDLSSIVDDDNLTFWTGEISDSESSACTIESEHGNNLPVFKCSKCGGPLIQRLRYCHTCWEVN